MKTAKVKILSVLLFAFTFFIFHDYVIVDVDADTQYELCYAEQGKLVLDLPSEIHHHIHMLLDVPNTQTLLLSSILATSQPLYIQTRLYSTTLSVLQRPPLV